MDYRAYFVGDDGRFMGVEEMRCADDEEATVQAAKLLADRDIELWQLARFVTRLRPRALTQSP